MEKENQPFAMVCNIEPNSLLTTKYAFIWLFVGFIVLAMAASAHGQAADQEFAYNNAKAKSDYNKFVSRDQAQIDFSDAGISNRQTLDFFKEESNRLSREISDLVEKIQPGTGSTLASDESDIVHVAILKNKLEYLEVVLKKWIKDGSF